MIQGNGQRQVTVNREDLIRKLKENLIVHTNDYKEAVIGYRIKLLTDLEEKYREVFTASDEEALVVSGVTFNPPRSYEKEYLDAITILEWQVGETVVLDQMAFKQFVQNEWNWSNQFDVMATTYKSFAASVGASR